MNKYSLGYRILTYLCTFLAMCVIILSPCCGSGTRAANSDIYRTKIIFTAPSAEKIFDGTPLTEQIDVTCQGLPQGYTYKAVAEGSVTYPEDNAENNNIVTDYIIYDPSGLNVTDKFVNVELRPGTLRISEKEAVLGAKRGQDDEKTSDINDSVAAEAEKTDDAEVTIEDDETALAARPFQNEYSQEILLSTFLLVIMFTVFIVFMMDSNKTRGK